MCHLARTSPLPLAVLHSCSLSPACRACPSWAVTRPLLHGPCSRPLGVPAALASVSHPGHSPPPQPGPPLLELPSVTAVTALAASLTACVSHTPVRPRPCRRNSGFTHRFVVSAPRCRKAPGPASSPPCSLDPFASLSPVPPTPALLPARHSASCIIVASIKAMRLNARLLLHPRSPLPGIRPVSPGLLKPSLLVSSAPPC